MKLKKIICGIVCGVLLLSGALAVCISSDVFVKSYTITFDVDGGAICGNETVKIPKGKKLKLPSATKDGYSLNGWYLDKELWTEDKIIDKNMTLKARWDKQKYLITFIVDGETYYEIVEHGSVPSFSGSVDKENTINEQFEFTGWKPTIIPAIANAVYEAEYNKKVREYNVNLSLSHEGAGNLIGGGKHDYNTNVTINAQTNNGYEFIGWYHKSSDELFSTSAEVNINNIAADYDLVAKFSIITKNITYYNLQGAEQPNKTNYDVRDGEFLLEEPQRNGYNFVGFYDGEDSDANKITTIDSSLLKDYNLYARWEIINYLITYTLNGGTNHSSNPASYTIETPTFTLFEPTKANDSFLGWAGSGLSKTTKVVTIEIGSTGNLEFAAVWTGGAKTISFVIGGSVIDELTIIGNSGDLITKPVINGTKYGMSGYDVTKWSTIGGEEFVFSSMPNADITLYGEWEYTINKGFIPYLTKFNTTSHTYQNPLIINSYAELVALVEYLTFYSKTEDYHFKLGYKSVTQSLLEEEMVMALDDCIYPINRIRYTNTYSNGVGYYSFSSLDASVEQNLLKSDESSLYTYEQIETPLAGKEYLARDNDFDNFNINKVNKTISVSTSNQLVYALEIGLKPEPVSGSAAEKVYNKAKEILRKICHDSMDEVEKARAIYEYLILNVEYDNYAADEIDSSWPHYDAWYAEGALIRGQAVCDGIAKAYLILARIENIPTIRINSNDHAWNKIMIDEKWYGVDATHGNTLISSIESEVLTYTSFMFTDEYKEGCGDISQNYDNYNATEEYNVYSNTEYINSDSQSIDLVIENKEDLEMFLLYISDEVEVNGAEFIVELVMIYSPQNYSIFYTILGISRISSVSFVDSLGNQVTCFIFEY